MRSIYIGETKQKINTDAVKGGFVKIENESFYKISNSNLMPDFFMSIVSDSDHWMYISSNGSLSAGRKDRDNALFPYYTDDKIHDYKNRTGSKTVLLISKGNKTYLWEPFSGNQDHVYTVKQHLYKSMYGNKIIYEEVNADLGIGFTYSWSNSDAYGFVRKSKITNLNHSEVEVALLDGICNILPYGIDYDFQNEYSNLLDAYKKCELLDESNLGLFMLSSIPVDRAEPSESLKATTVWSSGLHEHSNILLSNQQIEAFKKGIDMHTEKDVRAQRGAYLVHADVSLSSEQEKEWFIVAEINQDSAAVANLNNFLKSGSNIQDLVDKDIYTGTENLKKIVANADGLQQGDEALSCARHFSNTMFNVMRGGVFKNNYTLNLADFALFVKQTNQLIYDIFKDWLSQLPQEMEYHVLSTNVEKTGNADLMRIFYEYLPLTFSRRHGDPSRPWNQFSIETKNEDGSPKLNYQGNWRDIFQNWEALSLSYPEYIEGIIAKFVNASTPDGYNPYRITREGIDWECPDPTDPWAYIGYWGDHQIIYLQKLLELSQAFHPGKLEQMLQNDIFVYANVPYRIKSYADMIKNPQETIDFDAELNTEIKNKVKQSGADGRLLPQEKGGVYRVNLTEKILVTMLAKLSNFIPETGIWLNTQRPEWNDANNALVGNGVSMVTLYYLRRFLKFWNRQFTTSSVTNYMVSEEVKVLFVNTYALFVENIALLNTGFSDEQRRHFSDQLGEAGTAYREKIYKSSFSGNKEAVKQGDLKAFTELTIKYLDQSINVNKRADGLYHSYNLLSFSDKKIKVRYLYEMLEGQVAVLSSGYLNAQEGLEVLNALKASKLFRKDQYSYILYPDRELARFVNKNNIPAEKLKASQLLIQLLEEKVTSIVVQDHLGNAHFNGNFRNAAVLEEALDDLDPHKYGKLLNSEKQAILDTFEEMFDHQSFTGRSGTFYGYEGLGSIYWHMVSKLLLATQELYFDGVKKGADPVILGKLKDHYFEIKAGIGLYKSPELYGAFPTDAYSHTPANAGAKQPGMTGQVKEDVISRMAELGITVKKGAIVFNTTLLNREELLKAPENFEYYSLDGHKNKISLQSGQLAFTFCQVPVIYSSGSEETIRVTFNNGETKMLNEKVLDKHISSMLFKRSGEIERIDLTIEPA